MEATLKNNNRVLDSFLIANMRKSHKFYQKACHFSRKIIKVV
jgi:hypothetical protein